MEKAQQNQIWVLGTCERADSTIYAVQRDRNWMLVLGNEGSGLRPADARTLRSTCFAASAGADPVAERRNRRRRLLGYSDNPDELNGR